MPEGPEALQGTDYLIDHLRVQGQWLYFTNAFKFGDKFSNVDITTLMPALDQPIVDIFCKGKNYFILLANNITIRAHMGMKGHWDFEPNPQYRNTHFRFDFSSSRQNNPDAQGLYHPTLSLYFINNRFGELNIFTTREELIRELDRLAPGFIGRFILSKEEWTYTMNNLSKTKQLREVLMDQKELCSGIGNYLLVEIFYHAKLNPYLRVGDLYQISQRPETYGQAVNLVGYLYDVCLMVVNGFYHGTLEKLVYDKRLSPKGNPVIGEKRKANGEVVAKGNTRTTWYCPAEQFHPQQFL